MNVHYGVGRTDTDVLKRLPMTPVGQLGDLLPAHWLTAQTQVATLRRPVSDTTTTSAELTS